ncbi:MAG: energy transducer TonB [Verrucomicrobiota bacterium]
MPASAEPPEVTGHGLSRREIAAQALEPIVQAVPEGKRRLTGYLLLALLAHAALFWGVQLTYPTASRQPPPRVRAMLALPAADQRLLSAQEEAGRAFWEQLHDPSMLILPQDKLDADLAALRAPRPGEPVDAADLTASDEPSLLRPVNLRAPNMALPLGLLPLPRRAALELLPRPQAFIYPEPPATKAAAESQVRLSGPLASRRWVVAPEVPEPATEVLPPRGTTVVRLGVDASGEIIHALVVEGSGSAELDAGGLRAVRAGRFAPQSLNAPAQPARQPLVALEESDGPPGPTWPRPARTERQAPAPTPLSPTATPGFLTWGEAKIFWRLRAPEAEPATPKAGPLPPETP